MSTNFPSGLQSRGVPVGASGPYYGWWGTSYFVDNDSGNDGNTGKTPTDAFKNVDTAISASNAGGSENNVIYIKPKESKTDGSDDDYITPTATTANWQIPTTANGLAIVGTGNQSHIQGETGQRRVYLRGASGVTTGYVLQINAEHVSIENCAFHDGAVQADASVLGDDATIWFNTVEIGTISNCMFRWCSQIAVKQVDGWYIDVYNSTFYNCATGYGAHGSATALVNNHVQGCLFEGTATTTATSIGCDISIYSDSASDRGNYVADCDMIHQIPALSGGQGAYLYVKSGNGAVVRCYAASDNMVAATEYTVPSNFKILHCFDDSDAEWGTT